MTRSTVAMLLTILLAGAMGELGSVGFSFDRQPNSVHAPAPRNPELPRPLAPRTPPIESLRDGTDAATRAHSYYDAETGRLCHGLGAHKTCR